MEDRAKTRRGYDNRGRAEQARRNRRQIVTAAHDLLLAQGYRATTMTDIARAAGVSVETVYKAFGTKAALVKAVYDVALVGDDEPVPLVDRPELKALRADPDPASKLRRYAAIARSLGERIGPLTGVLLAGARSGGDPDLEALAATTDLERLTGATVMVTHLAEIGGLRPGLDLGLARDTVWALISPDLYRLLVVERGWSHDDYERWLADTLVTSLT
ncbi:MULTISPECIES: TetR/AcrR family transcriptional regulator [unclassified Pseudofrankia]|uniref:TetR/AcrR family transcriptional regulator n=1 Tax=unclassified Pseudofrankia TaxID=2994372 RepID=UPI0008D9A452|nr:MULTISPECIES: helix-turn-helix domain-containing protein [unclassified Pseudofrankia]MDT3444383.1 helix-turn-helix domain-containing protein [Pseudofrankia sp. BMG5.37]OHV56484.1 TetR family transcriptional regulator [Pseudofrankia sp. BMG5.36]